MTQLEFDMICKILQNGAPAVANDLIKAITDVITAANTAITERDELKKQLEKLTSDTAAPEAKKANGK